jgi:hypothetical protein
MQLGAADAVNPAIRQDEIEILSATAVCAALSAVPNCATICCMPLIWFQRDVCAI